MHQLQRDFLIQGMYRYLKKDIIYKYPVFAFLKIRPLNLNYMFNMSFSCSDPNGIPCGISGCNKILDCLNR